MYAIRSYYERLLWELPWYRGQVKVGTLIAVPVRVGEVIVGVLLADRLELGVLHGQRPEPLPVGLVDLEEVGGKLPAQTGPHRLAGGVDGVGVGVITSYSIHYTKLYDPAREPRFGPAHEARRWRDSRQLRRTAGLRMGLVSLSVVRFR